MWTGVNNRYHSILREQDREHKARMLFKRSEEAGARAKAGNAPVTAAAASTPVAAHSSATGAAASTRATSPGRRSTLPTVPVTSFADPSEGKVVVLDPVTALKLPPTAIKGMAELVFRGRGVTTLHPNFLLFESLEVLVLERNKLTTIQYLLPRNSKHCSNAHNNNNNNNSDNGNGNEKIDGGTSARSGIDTAAAVSSDSGNSEWRAQCTKSSLRQQQLTGPRGCVRLRHLLAGGNAVEDLEHTDIPWLVSLERLSLHGNRIIGLAKVASLLKRLHSLTVLDLSGNPVAEEMGYRAYMIRHLPQLRVLDQLAITEEERREVAEVHLKRNRERQQSKKGMLHNVNSGTDCLGVTMSSFATSLVSRSDATDRKEQGSGVMALGEACVAFGSRYHRAALTEHERAKQRKEMWGKSKCVQLMERRRGEYLYKEKQKVEVAEKEEANRVAALEHTRAAFHAVWALSHPGMPLSAAKLQEWNAQATTSAASEDVNSPVPSTVPSSQQQQVKSTGGGRAALNNNNSGGPATMSGGTSATGGHAAPALGAAATPTTQMPAVAVEMLLPLLPGVHKNSKGEGKNEKLSGANVLRQQQQQQGDPAYHQSVLFDALLHREEAVRAKTVYAGGPGWKEHQLPPRERLDAMLTAVDASGKLLDAYGPAIKAAVTSGGGIARGTVSAAAAGDGGKKSRGGVGRRKFVQQGVYGGSTTSFGSSIISMNTLAHDGGSAFRTRDLLTTIQACKPAIIPEPWEGTDFASLVRTPAAEVQEYLLRAAYLLLLTSELQAIETAYGPAEVLQVLRHAPPPVPGVNDFSGSMGSGSANSPPTSSRGRRTLQQGGNPALSGGAGAAGGTSNVSGSSEKSALGGGGSNARRAKNVQPTSSATISAILADEALLTKMEGPAVYKAGLALSADEIAAATTSGGGWGGAGGGHHHRVSISGGLGSGTSVSRNDATSAPPPGLIGYYTESSMDTFMGMLKPETGAWSMDTQALLQALSETHHVDLATSAPVPPLFRGDRTPSSKELSIASAAALSEDGGATALPTVASSGVGLVRKVPAPPQSRKASHGTSKRKGFASRGGLGGAVVEDGVVVLRDLNDKGGPAADEAGTAAAAAPLGGGAGGHGSPLHRGSGKKAYLSVNNMVAALVCFIPFVEAREVFFKAEAKRCATSTVEKEKAEARMWFSRSQHAAVHLEKLKETCRTLYCARNSCVSCEASDDGIMSEAVIAVLEANSSKGNLPPPSAQLVPARALTQKKAGGVGSIFRK